MNVVDVASTLSAHAAAVRSYIRPGAKSPIENRFVDGLPDGIMFVINALRLMAFVAQTGTAVANI